MMFGNTNGLLDIIFGEVLVHFGCSVVFGFFWS